jgi:hypothetical protein
VKEQLMNLMGEVTESLRWLGNEALGLVARPAVAVGAMLTKRRGSSRSMPEDAELGEVARDDNSALSW